VPDKENVLKHWLQELKRRKVFRIALAYLIGAWVLLQIADVTFEPLNLPPWSTSLMLWLLILGFPARRTAASDRPADQCRRWLSHLVGRL
jgi:adenylate cyclase